MATLTVVDKAKEIVVDGLTAESFMAFKRKCGKGCAVLVTLDCGEEILVDSCKLFRKLPQGAHYNARLLKRTTTIPEGVDAANHTVWFEA